MSPYVSVLFQLYAAGMKSGAGQARAGRAVETMRGTASATVALEKKLLVPLLNANVSTVLESK